MRKVGRRRVGTGMRMILRIGRWRSNVVGSLHRVILSIGRSGGCICGSIGSGRRRRKSEAGFTGFSGICENRELSEAGFPRFIEIFKIGSRDIESSLLPKIVLESGLQSPPTRDIICPYRGNLKLYLTFVRKYWIIRVASWSEVKPTPS